ncbi:MAG: hypothetical protein IPJ43_11540 [Saprospiraceae bacterium]|nr:hypothetical protein [Saprospiraceae bacterium]
MEVGHFTTREEVIDEKGTKKDVSYVEYNGAEYALEHQSTADGGLFGGGITNFYDFSITKNVAGMFLILALLSWLFLSMAKKYKSAPGTAPTGIQKLIEPLIMFIKEEVAIPFIGAKHERFMPLLLSLFS